jgi:pyridoxine kinase
MILSIQSHVAYGYVGNKAASFPLQSLGYDVWAINTVQFSNHTGYGKWQGEIFNADHIKNVIQGIRNLGVMGKCRAVLSGYLGDSTIGEVILSTVEDLRKDNPQILYLCDPVMGDVGRGIFVKDGITSFFKDRALPSATIITPNHFEAELLYGAKIETIEDAKKAADYFHNLGVKIFIITSFQAKDLDANQMQVFLSDGQQFLFGKTPLISFDILPNGTGDIFSALFLGNYLSDKNPSTALAKTLASTYYVINETSKLAQRELAIIGHDYKKIGDNEFISVAKF